MKTFAAVDANPYPWPFDAAAAPANTALLVIDMQFDFVGIGGYVDRMGYDLSGVRAPIEPIAQLLARARSIGGEESSSRFAPSTRGSPTRSSTPPPKRRRKPS